MNTKTVTLDPSDEYQQASALLDALADFNGASRVWRNVKVKAVGGTIRLALGLSAAPASDAASIGVEADETRDVAILDFENTWIRAGEYGAAEDSGSEEGSTEGGLLEIVGTPE